MKKNISTIVLVLLLSSILSLFSCEKHTNVDLESESTTDSETMGSAATEQPSDTVQSPNLSLSSTKLIMEVYDTQPIKVNLDSKYMENQKIEWSSTDSSIADYVNGNIIALNPGVCLIKVIGTHGDVASCMVTVYPQGFLAEKIYFSEKTISIEKFSTCDIPIQVSPSSADISNIKIETSDPNILHASYANGIITAEGIGIGEATIIATLPNGNSCSKKIVVKDIDKAVLVKLPDITTAYTCKFYGNRYIDSSSSVKITAVSLRKQFTQDGDCYVQVNMKCEKTYDYRGKEFGNSPCSWNCRLVGYHQQLIEQKTLRTEEMGVGQKFEISEVFRISANQFEENMHYMSSYQVPSFSLIFTDVYAN